MGTYKGNAGHLMQHWTLCELLDAAAQKHTPGLNYIDAHAMAPWATTRQPDRPNRDFDAVRVRLPGQKSVYEKAWHRLADQRVAGYPSSAAFVREVWKGDYSMLLCEIDPPTISAINNWLPGTRQQPNCKRAKLFPGNWRDRFERGLPSPADVGLPDNSLTLVSFDPNVCSRSPDPRNPRIRPWNLYPNDLEAAIRALNVIKGGILMLLSSYSSDGNNPQGAVIAAFDRILARDKFARKAKVRLNGHMMSLVYGRNVEWADKLAGLPGRFSDWMQKVGRRQRA